MTPNTDAIKQWRDGHFPQMIKQQQTSLNRGATTSTSKSSWRPGQRHANGRVNEDVTSLLTDHTTNDTENSTGSADNSSECTRAHSKVAKEREKNIWTSLAVQQLRLCTSSAGGVGSIPGWGTKIWHATWCGQSLKTKIFF